MLMAPATRAVGSSSTSSSISPPWHPVVLIPSHHHQVLVLHDLDLATPSPLPSPTTPASPPRHNHQHLRYASSCHRAAGKQPRRPRPSRKLPTATTYISADAASFRRMVHQATGFDDDVPPLHQFPGPEVLCRQAPAPLSRGALTMTETMLLPTLDTSAFLMLRATGRGGAAPARPPGVSSCCQGSSSDLGGG